MDKNGFDRRIRLRHLQCFVAIAQEQHLRKAAERLHLSQPAVSKTLADLEQMVGTRLVDRGRFGARLTRDGVMFLTHAVSVLDALEAARRAVYQGDIVAEEAIYIGALPTVGPDLLPGALSALRSLYPGAKVDIQIAANGPLLDRLQAGEVDVALGRMADPQHMVGLSFELLYVEPLLVVARAGHPLWDDSEISLHDVIEYPLVVSTKGTVPRHNTESFLQARGLKLPTNCVETLSVSLARLIAIQSDAVWFAPLGAVREDLKHGLLKVLPVASEGTEEPVGLLHRSDTPPRYLVQTFMQILRETAVTRRAGGANWRRVN